MAALGVQLSVAVITVQIGGANRLSSLSRSRDRYRCYWDCDLVGCQIAREDDECAYDCEKICRVKYDYMGRSGSDPTGAPQSGAEQLGPKSGAPEAAPATGADELLGGECLAGPGCGVVGAKKRRQTNSSNNIHSHAVGQSVRLHLPRNASARNFAIWERCSADSETGKLTEKPFASL